MRKDGLHSRHVELPPSVLPEKTSKRGDSDDTMDTNGHVYDRPCCQITYEVQKSFGVCGRTSRQSVTQRHSCCCLAKAKEWARQQANPMGGELTGPICQVQMPGTVGKCVSHSPCSCGAVRTRGVLGSSIESDCGPRRNNRDSMAV